MKRPLFETALLILSKAAKSSFDNFPLLILSDDNLDCSAKFY